MLRSRLQCCWFQPAVLAAQLNRASGLHQRQEIFLAKSPSHTEHLAHLFARELAPATRYFLKGSVGAGKSTFSRAFIRQVYEDDLLEVPSPSYLLQNIYDEMDGPPIHHFDFYRLSEADFGRLDLKTCFKNAVSLIEWPEQLPIDKEKFERIELKLLYWDEAVKDEDLRKIVEGNVDSEDECIRIIKIYAIGAFHAKLLSRIRNSDNNMSGNNFLS